MPNVELTKIEKVALAMFTAQIEKDDLRMMEPKIINELIHDCFGMSYKFLDISKEFQRTYE